jgi:hypothetical protein
MAGELFKRAYGVAINQANGFPILEITESRIEFTVAKAWGKQQNTCELKIHNMSPNSRNKISQYETLQVELVAGYVDTAETIFKGDMRSIRHDRQGTNIVTTIASGDGEKSAQEARINESFAPGTPLSQIEAQIASAFGPGVAAMKAAQKLRAGELAENESALDHFLDMAKGFVASGNVRDEFDKLMKGAGKDWSVVDGTLVTVAPGETTLETPMMLGPTSGQIGFISKSQNAKSKSVLTATSLLQPGFNLGRRVILTSPEWLNVTTRVEKVSHRGDSHGQIWQSDLELKTL